MLRVLSSLAVIATADSLVPRCILGPAAKGPDVSCIAYGTLHLHEAGNASAALSMIQTAVSLGITTFDLSDVYQQQPELFGAAIQLQPSLRSQIQVIAKMDIVPALGGYGYDTGSAYDSSCTHLTAVVARYLSALATTYIDVLVLHHQDYLLDVVEFAACAQAFRAAGSVLHFGVSNFDQEGFRLLNQAVPLVTNELEVSVLNPKPMWDGTCVGRLFFLGGGHVVE